MRTVVAGALILVLFGCVALLVGCGGSSDGTPPSQTQGSTIRGAVNTAGGEEYDVYLNGQLVPGAMQEDGSFVIEGVPPGEHRVAVVQRGGLAGGYATVEVGEGEQVECPEIVPQLGGQIAGMVTVEDEQGLRALEGVKVTAVPTDLVVIMSRPSQGDVGPNIYPPPPLPEYSAFTDAQGSYVIPAVPEGEYTVSVAVPGYMESYQWVYVAPGRTAVADFQLRPYIEPGLGTVEGQVLGVTDDGLVPIEGAVVTVCPDQPWRPIVPPERPLRGVPPRSGLVDNSDADDDGCGNGTEDPGEEPGDEPDCELPPPWFYAVSAVTDAEGRYSMQVPAGYASIDVWADGYEPAWEQIVVQADQVLTKDFQLQPWQWVEPPFPQPVPLPEPRPRTGTR